MGFLKWEATSGSPNKVARSCGLLLVVQPLHTQAGWVGEVYVFQHRPWLNLGKGTTEARTTMGWAIHHGQILGEEMFWELADPQLLLAESSKDNLSAWRDLLLPWETNASGRQFAHTPLHVYHLHESKRGGQFHYSGSVHERGDLTGAVMVTRATPDMRRVLLWLDAWAEEHEDPVWLMSRVEGR